MKHFAAIAFLLAVAALPLAAQAPVSPYEVRGTVKSGSTPIPGVTVTAANTLTGKKVATSTDLGGNFVLAPPSPGRYVVRAEMPVFHTVTSEVLITAAKPQARVDVALLLASRAPRVSAPNQMAGLDGAAAQEFSPDAAAGARGGDAPLADMPAMANSPDASNEAVAVSGTGAQTMRFGGRDDGDVRQRLDAMRARGQLGPGMGGGGFGGPGAPGLGGPMIFRMRGGRSFADIMAHPHGSVFFSTGGSVFNAQPYDLSTSPASLPDYSNFRFGGTVGGRLKIPHLFDAGPKTFFFANLFGTRGDSPFSAFSHVPTDLERSGDFSQTLLPNGSPVQLFDPATHLPIAGEKVAISPQAQALLKFIPQPNAAGPENFRFVATSDTSSTVGAFRIMRQLGAAPAGPMRFGPRGRNAVNFGFNISDSTAQQLSAFPLLGGTLHTRGLNVNGGYVRSHKEWTNILRLSFNQERTDQRNRFAGLENVAAAAGIGGVSTAPSDWGVPNLSFTNYRGLTDLAPRSEHDLTLGLGDTVAWFRGKHNVRFGGDYRRLRALLRTNTNPRGTFVFTGALTAAQGPGGPVQGTGYDFADFLLGLPQQTSIQFSPNSYQFTANDWDLFAMDDWRVRGNLTVNFGLRYEYFGPYTEAHNHLVNLDIAPGFAAVAPVFPGQAGAFTGVFPASLVSPDRNNFAPRVGIAWKPFSNTVVRAGYGINYDGGQYRDLVQHLAFQPPFSFTETNVASAAQPLTLADGFPAAPAPGVTNNYAVDRNYRLGYVQLWDVSVQRDLGRNMFLDVIYTGSKGTRLDIVEAPDRGPSGLLIPGVQPYLFETSNGDSILHAGSVTFRRRFTGGLSLGATYTYSKSIDNASSIGGGATVVAQDPLDLAAERGLSSFDQRHRFTGDYIVELPFGPDRRWFNHGGALGRVIGDWEWSGSFTIASGSPWTAQVLGAFADVAQGVNGTLRADTTGQPISVPNPGLREWFNTAAFTVPPPGQFGNAGRNTIIGPGSLVFNMSLSKTFQFKDFYALELRLDGNNVFNTPQFTSLDTVVNSPTFGQVVGVGNMRQMQVATRFRF